MRLVLNKDSTSKIIYFEILYVLFYNLIIELTNLPSAITYVVDFLNIFVFIFLIYSNIKINYINKFKLKGIYISVILLFCACLLTAILNMVNPILVIWSTRNLLRYFPFFLSIITFWETSYVDKFINILIWLQIPNLALNVLQFYIFGYSGDQLGGIFGTFTGCNGFVNIYMCVVVTIVVERYLHGKSKFGWLVFTLLSWLFIASMAELKIAFMEIPLIILVAIFLNKPSLKIITIVLIVTIGLCIGCYLIVMFFPQWASAFISIESLLDVGSLQGGGYNISRTNAFSDINSIFFKGSIFYNIFGYGFGNCEYSTFDLFTSDFYRQYGYLNYRWFSHQMWFLQTGYIGIFFFTLFFVMCFIWITKRKHKYSDIDGIGSFGQIFIILIFVNFIYNSSLITEIGYITFAALALPFVYYKKVIFDSGD